MAVGRPRAFDTEQALARALEVFWEKGYDGASLPDLTAAMGINRPSLYAAFGNKESLFRKALDAYTAKAEAEAQAALDAPTAREGIANFLNLVIAAHACPHTPKGCLLVHAALTCGDGSEHIRQELVARRGRTEDMLRRRLDRAVDDGELQDREQAASLAKFYATVVQGMSVQGKGGACGDSLKPVVDAALRAFPA